MNEQTSTVPPLPPPPVPPPPPGGRHRRFRTRPGATPWYRTPVARDPEAGKVSGVVAGLSRSFQFDVRTTRLAVALATLVLPVIGLVYLAAWFLLPANPSQAMPLEDVVRDRRRIPLLVALVLVGLASLGWVGSWFYFGGLPWGLGLIAIGVLLWAWPDVLSPAPTTAPDAPVTAPPVAAPPRAGDVFTRTTAGDPLASDALLHTTPTSAPTAAMTGAPVAATTLPPPVTVRPRRRWYPVAPYGMLTTIGVLAVMIAGHRLGWWPLTVLGLVTTAACLLFTASFVHIVVNRRWLSFPSVIVLGGVATFLLVVQPNLNGGVGQRTLRPTSAAAIAETSKLAVGNLDVDLAGLPMPAGATTTFSARLGLGHLHVVVPNDVQLVIDASVGAGDVRLDGRQLASGLRTSDHWTEPATVTTSAGTTPSSSTAGPTATLHLTLDVGAGDLAIDRTTRVAP